MEKNSWYCCPICGKKLVKLEPGSIMYGVPVYCRNKHLQGGALPVYIVVFVLGNLWFHFVESLLERIKHLLTSRRDRLPGIPFRRMRRNPATSDLKGMRAGRPPAEEQY